MHDGMCTFACLCVFVCDWIQMVNVVVELTRVVDRHSVFCWNLNGTFRLDRGARCRSRSRLLHTRWGRISSDAPCQWDEKTEWRGMLQTTTAWTTMGLLFYAVVLYHVWLLVLHYEFFKKGVTILLFITSQKSFRMYTQQ